MYIFQGGFVGTSAADSRFAVPCPSDRNALRNPPRQHVLTVRHKRRKTNDSGNFAAKRQEKMETANAQNSTFANRTSRHTTKICKRAVFLPTHTDRQKLKL